MAADTVVDQVKAQVSDARVRLAMLVGSSLEGGWGPTFNEGDHGTSFGPFQMHWGGALGPTPTTAAEAARSRANAQDPAWAVAHMKGAYSSAVAKIPNDVWSATPELAAVTAAYYAERPAVPYQSSQGQSAVDAAYKKAKSALGGGGGWSLNPITDLNHAAGAVGGAVTGIPGDIAGAAKDAVGSIVSPIVGDVKNLAIKLGFVGLGMALVVAGAYQVSKPVTDKIAAGAQTAGLAAAA